MKFIEMSKFKVVLTGCALLLMLNCYQLYGDDFRVFYDEQTNAAKTERTPNQSANISVELAGIQTWEAATDVFSTVVDVILFNNIRDNNPCFSDGSKLYLDILICLCNLEAQNNPPGKMETFQNLGNLFQIVRRFEAAELCYVEAMRIAKNKKDPLLMAALFQKLSMFYMVRGDTSSANLALRYSSEVDSTQDYPVIRQCRSSKVNSRSPFSPELELTYIRQGRFQEVEAYYRNEVFRVKMGDLTLFLLPNATSDLGEFYERQGKFSEAEECYKEAIRVAKTLNFDRVLDEVRVRDRISLKLSILYRKCGRLSEAQELYKNVIRTGKNLLSTIFLFKDVGESYNEQNRFSEAERCYTDAIRLGKKASIIARESSAQEARDLDIAVSRVSVTLAMLYRDENRLSEAKVCLEDAIKIATGTGDFMTVDFATKYLRKVQELQEKSSSTSSTPYSSKGPAHQSTRDSEDDPMDQP